MEVGEAVYKSRGKEEKRLGKKEREKGFVNLKPLANSSWLDELANNLQIGGTETYSCRYILFFYRRGGLSQGGAVASSTARASERTPLVI